MLKGNILAQDEQLEFPPICDVVFDSQLLGEFLQPSCKSYSSWIAAFFAVFISLIPILFICLFISFICFLFLSLVLFVCLFYFLIFLFSCRYFLALLRWEVTLLASAFCVLLVCNCRYGWTGLTHMSHEQWFEPVIVIFFCPFLLCVVVAQLRVAEKECEKSFSDTLKVVQSFKVIPSQPCAFRSTSES